MSGEEREPLEWLEQRSQNNLERMRHADSQNAEWVTLHAYMARVDCDDDRSSARHEARLAFGCSAFDRLLARDGKEYALADPHRRSLVRRWHPEMFG